MGPLTSLGGRPKTAVDRTLVGTASGRFGGGQWRGPAAGGALAVPSDYGFAPSVKGLSDDALKSKNLTTATDAKGRQP